LTVLVLIESVCLCLVSGLVICRLKINPNAQIAHLQNVQTVAQIHFYERVVFSFPHYAMLKYFDKFDNLRQDTMKKDIMERLGDLFREKRESKSLLLRQAAAQLEIDQAVLSKIERNERKATKEQLDCFSRFYGLELKELFISWNSERITDLLSGEDDIEEILKRTIKNIKE